MPSLWARGGHPDKSPKWKQRCEFALQRWQVHCRAAKGTCSFWEPAINTNSWGRKGCSELMFILMLFVSLLKQLPGWFWARVLIPKKRFCANSTCMVENTTSHCCHCATFLSLIMWNCVWLPAPADGRHMCAQHPHFIALINKMKAFPPLTLSW